MVEAVLWPLSWLLSTYTSLVLAGVIVSNGAFVIAAVLLYRFVYRLSIDYLVVSSYRKLTHRLSLTSIAIHNRLSFMVLHDEALALTSALLFCLTPANIHMSAMYAERSAVRESQHHQRQRERE